MALNAYLRLKGIQQGEIKGSVTQKGREGKILVLACDHEVVSPRDAASGLATGRRQHKPFTITKELDQSSPLLYRALVNNETITEWELQFWTPQIKASTGAGAEVQHYTVRLSGVHISGIHFSQHDTRNPDFAKYAESESVSFTYTHIEWLWVKGGISSSDDWSSPAAAAKPTKPAKVAKAAKTAKASKAAKPRA
jgi:type VI secretion system secreted protein Hcp